MSESNRLPGRTTLIASTRAPAYPAEYRSAPATRIQPRAPRVPQNLANQRETRVYTRVLSYRFIDLVHGAWVLRFHPKIFAPSPTRYRRLHGRECGQRDRHAESESRRNDGTYLPRRLRP